MQLYDIGDELAITGTFTNAAGAAADPTIITVTIKAPNGTRTVLTYGTDLTVIRIGTGVYQYALLLTQADDWYYRVAGTGTVNAAEEGTARVRRQLTAAT